MKYQLAQFLELLEHLPICNPNVEKHVAKKLGLKVEPISTQVIPRDRHAFYFSVLGIIAGSQLKELLVEIRHLQRTEVYELARILFEKIKKVPLLCLIKKIQYLSENLNGTCKNGKKLCNSCFRKYCTLA